METVVVVHFPQQFQQADLQIAPFRRLIDLVAQVIHRLGVLTVGHVDVGALHGVHVLVVQILLGHRLGVRRALLVVLGAHHRGGVEAAVVIVEAGVVVTVSAAALPATHRQQNEQQQHRQGGADIEQIVHDQTDDTPAVVVAGGGGRGRLGGRIHRLGIRGWPAVAAGLIAGGFGAGGRVAVIGGQVAAIIVLRRRAVGRLGAAGGLFIRPGGAVAAPAVRLHRHGGGRFFQQLLVHLGALLLTEPAQFFLERGDLLVAQFQQPLAGFHLAVQVADTTAQFVVLALQAVQILVADRQLVLQRGGVGPTAVAAGAVAVTHPLGAVRRDQGDAAVAVIAGAVAVRLLAAGGVHRCPGRSGTALIAQALPLTVLRRHPGQRLAAGQVAHLAFRGQPQHGALAHQVHVVVDKGVRVALLDRQHHLLHGHARVGPGALGDAPHGV